MVDTSTEAVTKLLEGVTPGPWTEHDAGKHPYVFVCGPEQLYYNGDVKDKPLVAYVTGFHAIQNRAFIRAARDLVPALLAERDALRRENENLRQIERNVQAVREHEYKRAYAALAEVDRLKALAVTVQDAARVVLENLDDVWDGNASTAMDNARGKAKRDGHKYRTIDREGFRAALRAIADTD